MKARLRREDFDPSRYLVIGPENCAGSLSLADHVGADAAPEAGTMPTAPAVAAFERVLGQAVEAGFTCIQVRSKTSTARECLDLLARAAGVIERAGASGRVALLMNDRLDVALAARLAGIAVDGVHVGQSDVPPEACRALLGPDAIVGLSAHAPDIARYLDGHDGRSGDVDYFGVGPLHPTASKPDLEKDSSGATVTRTLDEVAALARTSPVPVVVGGGVTAADLPALREAGAAGFFVISAVCGSDDPGAAARELANAWNA